MKGGGGGAAGPGPSTTETSVDEIASQQQGTGDEPQSCIKEIDLRGLTEEQCKLAINMLIEEQDSFMKNDDDIGTIVDLKVQKNYVAVPLPRSQELYRGPFESRFYLQVQIPV